MSKSKSTFNYQLTFGDKILKNKNNILITQKNIKKKILGLYFSASWCPPCQEFTSQLIKIYLQNQKKYNFEIVLIPFRETNKINFERYFQKMPWLSISPENHTKITNLINKYKCTRIPTLIFINNQGKIIRDIIGLKERQTMIKNPKYFFDSLFREKKKSRTKKKRLR